MAASSPEMFFEHFSHFVVNNIKIRTNLKRQMFLFFLSDVQYAQVGGSQIRRHCFYKHLFVQYEHTT